MFSGRKSLRTYFSLLIGLVLFSGACGDNLPSSQPVTSSQVQGKSSQDQILEELDAISAKLDQLTAAKSSSLPSGTPTTKPSTSATVNNSPAPSQNTPTANPAPSASPAPTATDPLAKGRKILDKIMDTFKTAVGIDAQVQEYEKNLKTGFEVNNLLQIYTNPTKLVKMDVISGSDGNTGIKILYTSGDSGKVKVRPNGVASLITTDLSKDDTRVVHQNGYRLDYTDFHGMISRFSDPNYQAELTGKTDMSGLTVYILKVTHKTQNTLDPRITYENIGFESKDFSVRLWEAYEKSSNKPFIKFYLKSLVFRNISDSDFKI